MLLKHIFLAGYKLGMRTQLAQQTDSESSSHAIQKTLAVCTQFVFTCSISLLTKATITNRGYEYDTQTVPFFSEILKLFLSVTLCFLSSSTKNKDEVQNEIRVNTNAIFLSAVPSAMYFVSNNLNFIIIRELGASNFQLLNNLKILSTAVCHRLIMNTSLAAIQYRMLLLIMLGCMASQINHNLNSEDPNIQLQQSEINIGYLYMFCNIFLGAFSSVGGILNGT